MAWEAFLDATRPDAVICDHSPAALIALRDKPIPRATFGVGFCHPPDISPLPILRAPPGTDPGAYARDEALVLEMVNETLRQRIQSPLNRLSQLYAEVNDIFLTTFSELDNYPTRQRDAYYGTWNPGVGEQVAWPPGERPRVFACLKNGPTVPAVLMRLAELQLATIIFAPELPEGVRGHPAAPHPHGFARPYGERDSSGRVFQFFNVGNQ